MIVYVILHKEHDGSNDHFETARVRSFLKAKTAAKYVLNELKFIYDETQPEVIECKEHAKVGRPREAVKCFNRALKFEYLAYREVDM